MKGLEKERESFAGRDQARTYKGTRRVFSIQE
jgi:hypothetical protein